MRRGTLLVLGLLLASSALTPGAEARPRGLGAVLGVLTNPIGTILGAGRHAGRRAHYRRTYASRSRHRYAAPARSTVPAAVATGAAVGTMDDLPRDDSVTAARRSASGTRLPAMP